MDANIRLDAAACMVDFDRAELNYGAAKAGIIGMVASIPGAKKAQLSAAIPTGRFGIVLPVEGGISI